MASFTTFLIVYLFGGLTFLPLLLAAAIYVWTRPVLPEQPAQSADGTPADPSKQSAGRTKQDDFKYDGLVFPGDDVKALETARREHAKERGGGTKKHQDTADDFATAGYFAVYRKYVAMGVNLKPIERGSSVGSAQVAPPSPSVYQTFFRSMLNKKPGPETVEVSNAASPRPKNARNMFYVVLRHGHLILFDDDQQVDVRHVIKLADHDVKIYSGADVTPEGELFIKRNAIHLSPKKHERAKAHNTPTPQPWFFYCENCSEKEDFYFALLRSQERAPQPHEIDVRHLTALMERLHTSEEASEVRWLNALLGRLFLGIYKTPDVLKFVESKVITKLSRTPRPSFISSLVVQRVDIGETTPQITSPRLKSLTAEGECIVEADVRYKGRFEIDLAATIRVSTPIGQQEVKTSLAVVLTQIEGHMLFKIKGPPSNRIWFTFRHMPKIEFETRPIIMARQLTWPVFIQIIEGKIKEAISDSIVLPFWDDTPFFPTEKKTWRGGLWEDETDLEHEGTAIRTAAAGGASVETGTGADTKDASSTGVSVNTPEGEENVSPAVLRLRRLSKTHSAPTTGAPTSPSVNAAGVASSETANATTAKSINRKQRSGDAGEPKGGMSPPKRFSRASSALASPSEPTVGTDRSNAEASIPSSSPPKNGKNATSAMSWLSSGTLRSRKSSVSSFESSALNHAASRVLNGLQSSSKDEVDDGPEPIFPVSDSETAAGRSKATPLSIDDGEPGSTDGRSIASHSARASSSSLAGMAASGSRPSLVRNSSAETSFTTTITSDSGTPPAKRSAVLAAAMTGAAQSAKRWGISALQRRAAAAADRKAKAGLEHRTSSGEPLDLSKPMGGGRPLPPPGEPLPRPGELALTKESTSTTPPTRITPIKRRTTNELALRDQVPAPVHEQKIKRKELHPRAQAKPIRQPVEPAQRDQSTSDDNRGRRRQNTGGGGAQTAPTAGLEQEDIMVVEAPVDSESDASEEEIQDTHEEHEEHDGHEEHDEHGEQDEHEEREERKECEEHEYHGPREPGQDLHDSPAKESKEAIVEVLGTNVHGADDHRPESSRSINETRLDYFHDQSTPPDADSAGGSPEGSGHESPVADNDADADTDADADADDVQWGTLAESVISAFLEGGEEGQATAPIDAQEAHGAHDEHEQRAKNVPSITFGNMENGGLRDEAEPDEESTLPAHENGRAAPSV